MGNFLKSGVENLTTKSLETALTSAGLNAQVASFISTQVTDSFAADIFSVNQESTYDTDKRPGETRIPGPGQEGGEGWGRVWGFLGRALPVLAAAGLAAHYLSDHNSGDSSPNPPNSSTPTTADLPLPSGATAVSYQDLSGQTRLGFKIGSDTDYRVYDRRSTMAVQRVRGPLTEEGSFESQFTQESGSMVLDLKNPDTLKSGKVTYTTPEEGKLSFKVKDGKVEEIRIEKPSPDIVPEPNTTKDASGKITNGVIRILPVGLALHVSNGKVSKEQGGNGLSSKDLVKALKKTFLFGNGFENERRPEDTHDPLMEDYVKDLAGESIIDRAKEIIVDLYELTKIVGNGIDWITNFPTQDVKAMLSALDAATAANGGLWLSTGLPTALNWLPEAVKQSLRNYWGIGNDLLKETIEEIEKKGPLEDAVAFVHSGATAPVLAAIEKMQYDVNTVIIYEGPHPDYKTEFTNPSLKRIIHVMGSNHGLLNSFLEGDSPVPYLGWANFGGVENINIEIKGAFHSDFSYDEAAWDRKIANAPPSAKSALQREKERNRRVNVFMRALYKISLEDQTAPGRLELFLENTPGVEYNKTTKFASIDLAKLILAGI